MKKLMKEVLDDKVEEESQVAAMHGDGGNGVGVSKAVDVAARGQVDVERVRQHTGAAAWQRQPHSSKQQATTQVAKEEERESEGRAVREGNGQGERETGERKKERNGEGEKGRSEQEEKGREERESARKGGEKGKEEAKEAVGKRSEQVEKDVMDWTVVRRKKQQRKRTVQIFVKVNESKAFPLHRRQSRRRDEADPEGRGRVRDDARKSAEKRREAEELWSQ